MFYLVDKKKKKLHTTTTTVILYRHIHPIDAITTIYVYMYISVHQQAAGRRLKIRFTMSRAQRAWVVYVFVCVRTDNNSISFTCSICTNANDICSNTPLYNMLHRATFGAQVAVNNRRIFVLRLKLSSQLHETIFNAKDDKNILF